MRVLGYTTEICVVLSLAHLTNLPHLVNNKKKLDNEMSESVDGSLRTEKTYNEIYNENKTKSTKIP